MAQKITYISLYHQFHSIFCIRYLESKLDESRQQVKSKDQENRELKDVNEHLRNQLRKLSEDIKYANIDVDNIKEQYTNENQNVVNLEKLNRDINKENKKLMMDFMDSQQKLQGAVDECQSLKEMVSRAANEQSSVEKMLTNTQQSNSELLNANKIAKDDLKSAHLKIVGLHQAMEGDEKDRIILENKLLSLEKEFENATRDLHQENKELKLELEQSRKLVAEFEAILDQGQLDFDEMEAHLDKYRTENGELDKRLHEALKLLIKLQSEREELDRRSEGITAEMVMMKESLERERKFSESWSKEKEALELQLDQFKGKEESQMKQIVNLREETNSRLDLLESKDNKIESLETHIVELTGELNGVKSQLETVQTVSDVDLKESCVDCGNDACLKGSCVDCTNRPDVEELLKEQQDCQKLLEKKDEQLRECANVIHQLESQRELEDDHKTELFSQLKSLETELDDEKINHEKDIEDCLKEISNLRNHITDQEVASDKMAYDNRKLGYELSEALERNDHLEERLDGLLDETDIERNTMIETIALLEEKVNNTDDTQEDELKHLRSVVQQLEELRQQDETALKSSRRVLSNKDKEMQALREDVFQLKISLDKYESENTELTKSMSTLESSGQQYKAKMLQDLREQEQSLQMLQERSNAEGQHKDMLRHEVERLSKEIERTREESKENQKEYSQQKQQMQARIEDLLKSQYQLENMNIENENLKSDIEYFLSDRKDHGTMYKEISQLRAETANLRFKLRRLEDAEKKNQRLEEEVMNSLSVNNEELDNYQLLNENRKLKLDIEKLQVRMKQQPSLDELQGENNKLKEELRRKINSIMETDHEHIYRDLQSENEQLRMELEEALAMVNDQESQQMIDSLKSENQHLKNDGRELDKLRAENQKLKIEAMALNHKQSSNAGQNLEMINALTKDNQRLKIEVQQLKDHKILEREQHYATSNSGADLTRENMLLKDEIRELNKKIITTEDQQQQHSNNHGSLERENQQLKTENRTLQAKSERVGELTQENRILKHELREIENKHIAANERLKSENVSLKKQVDTLFKKNQDLELSNTSRVSTKTTNTPQQLSFKQKAASYDNLAQASWNTGADNTLFTSEQSISMERLHRVEKTPTKVRSLEQLPLNSSRNQQTLELPHPRHLQRTPSVERVPSFSSQTGRSGGPYIKPLKVKFANSNPPDGNSNNDIKTSPQVKSILNPFQGHQHQHQHDIVEKPRESLFNARTKSPNMQLPPPPPAAAAKQTSNALKDRPDVSQFSLISFDDDAVSKSSPTATTTHQIRREPRIDSHWFDKDSATRRASSNSLLDAPFTEGGSRRATPSPRIDASLFDPAPRESDSKRTSKVSASWFDSLSLKENGLERTPSIKDNPFFELDRSVNISQSKSANSSPSKSYQQQQQQQQQPATTNLPKDIIKFDMRPQSTEPAVKRRQKYKTREPEFLNTSQDDDDDNGFGSNVGNEFVKRLKGMFESSTLKGR